MDAAALPKGGKVTLNLSSSEVAVAICLISQAVSLRPPLPYPPRPLPPVPVAKR